MKPCLAVLSPGCHSDTPQYPVLMDTVLAGLPLHGASSLQSLLGVGFESSPVSAVVRDCREGVFRHFGCICVGAGAGLAVPWQGSALLQYPSLAWYQSLAPWGQCPTPSPGAPVYPGGAKWLQVPPGGRAQEYQGVFKPNTRQACLDPTFSWPF